MDFLLVLIECFAWRYEWTPTLKIGVFSQTGQLHTKFQVEGVAPTNHSSQKTRLNDLSYVLKIWAELSSVLSQSTCLSDGQTDSQTDSFLVTRPPCIQCRGVKMQHVPNMSSRRLAVWRVVLILEICLPILSVSWHLSRTRGVTGPVSIRLRLCFFLSFTCTVYLSVCMSTVYVYGPALPDLNKMMMMMMMMMMTEMSL